MEAGAEGKRGKAKRQEREKGKGDRRAKKVGGKGLIAGAKEGGGALEHAFDLDFTKRLRLSYRRIQHRALAGHEAPPRGADFLMRLLGVPRLPLRTLGASGKGRWVRCAEMRIMGLVFPFVGKRDVGMCWMGNRLSLRNVWGE